MEVEAILTTAAVGVVAAAMGLVPTGDWTRDLVVGGARWKEAEPKGIVVAGEGKLVAGIEVACEWQKVIQAVVAALENCEGYVMDRPGMVVVLEAPVIGVAVAVAVRDRPWDLTDGGSAERGVALI